MDNKQKALKMLEKARLEGALIAFQSVEKILSKKDKIPEDTKKLIKAFCINTENLLKEIEIILKIN